MEQTEQTRLAYLDAMGIPAWQLRFAPASSPLPAGRENLEATSPPLPAAEGAATVIPPLPAGEGAGVRAAFASPASSDEKPAAQATKTPPPNPPPPGAGTLLPAVAASAEILQPPIAPQSTHPCNWDGLRAEVASCTRCPLHQTRTQTVFGVGDTQADWLVIGEAPGEQEDLQGEPFVGPAGLLLNEMLRAIGLARQQVYIANILKCRPPKNRDPQVQEVAACEGYLRQQIAFIRPKIILAVGRIAAQNLLKTAVPVGKLRGLVHDYHGVPLVVVYHPAYLLRSPLEKRAAFNDLRLALHTYRQNQE